MVLSKEEINLLLEEIDSNCLGENNTSYKEVLLFDFKRPNIYTKKNLILMHEKFKLYVSNLKNNIYEQTNKSIDIIIHSIDQLNFQESLLFVDKKNYTNFNFNINFNNTNGQFFIDKKFKKEYLKTILKTNNKILNTNIENNIFKEYFIINTMLNSFKNYFNFDVESCSNQDFNNINDKDNDIIIVVLELIYNNKGFFIYLILNLNSNFNLEYALRRENK